MTGLLKNRLRWDAIFEEHFWSSRLRWFSPGRRWRMSSSTTFPRCSKPRTPRCTLWSRWVSSFRVIRDFWPFWILKEKSADKMIGNILTNNFYHRTRRRGTNCPPDHRMENTLAKGPVSRGQMWSDCFVFKSAADQCGHIDFFVFEIIATEKRAKCFQDNFLKQIRCKIKRIHQQKQITFECFFFIQSSNKPNQKPNSTKSPGSFMLVKMKDDQLGAVGFNAMGGSSYIVCQYCEESQ